MRTLDLGLPACEMGGWMQWVVSGAPDVADTQLFWDFSLKGVDHQGRPAPQALASEHSPPSPTD